jgi:hypothetical protein
MTPVCAAGGVCATKLAVGARTVNLVVFVEFVGQRSLAAVMAVKKQQQHHQQVRK